MISPIEKVINIPVKLEEWGEESFTSRKALLEETADLRANLLLLKARLQKTLALEQENAQLRVLLQSQPRANDRLLVAQLIAVNPDPFEQQIILNKGKKQGVYIGQPVLDGNGVFGQIIQLNSLTSRVMLITDTRSAVPIQDSRSGVRGIVAGKGDSTTLSLNNMPVTADIQVGDLLVTSGLGEHFPLGYPVGKIVSINKSTNQQFAEITVKPSAHLFRSHLVLLIWPSFKRLA